MADRWLIDKTTGQLLIDEKGYPLSVESSDIGGGSGYIEAELVPSNTDINTYRGENYWGKTFYAPGNNSVINLPIAGMGFNLEVKRVGLAGTSQLIFLGTVGDKRALNPTLYTRTNLANNEWTEWQEVAEEQGAYPSMGAGRFIGTRVAENTDLNSLIPSSSNTALHYYCDSIAAAQTFENCPVEVPFNMIAFAPQASGGRYSQILFAISMPEMIFSRYCNNNSWSGWRQYTTTDGTYPDMTVGGAEYLSRRAKINNTSSSANLGWYKIGTISVENIYGGYDTYSCVMLINGLNAGQYHTSGAASESGTIEIDVRREGTTINFSNAGVSVLSGNVISNSVAVVRTSELVTLYYRLPAGYESAEFVILSENTKNEANICPSIFQFDTEYYGSTAPSGAVYAVRRNIASQSEKDIETISASGTTFTFGFADDTSKNVTVATDELEEVELSDVMPSTNILSNTTFGRTGVDNSVTTFSNYAAKYSQINAVYMYSIGSDGSPIASGSNNISIQDSVRYGDIRLVYTNTSTQGLKILRPISITQGIGLNANAFTILFIDYNDDSGSFVPYACLYSITTGKFSNLPTITGYNLSGMAVEGILPYVSST